MKQKNAYPSDISDARWKIIEPMINDRKQIGRQREVDLREVVNGINYRWETGCAWRMLPHDYPKWETIYTYFHRWQQDGRLWKVREILLRKSPYVPDLPKSNPRVKARNDRLRFSIK